MSAAPSFPPAPAPDQGAACSGLVTHIEGENFWLQRNPARVDEIGAMLEVVEVMKSAKDVKEGSAVVASWDGWEELAAYDGAALHWTGGPSRATPPYTEQPAQVTAPPPSWPPLQDG